MPPHFCHYKRRRGMLFNLNRSISAMMPIKHAENIDFSVPQNSFTAIIGTSGSGKTTLLNLLLRFWDVDSGKITLGGADIRHMEQDQLMKYCSVVFQDNFLFSCSIAENIAYGIENVTEEAIINAAKQARIHDFIITLPEQYQTKVGERGQLLSGGQKQRISIARRLFTKSPDFIARRTHCLFRCEKRGRFNAGISYADAK